MFWKKLLKPQKNKSLCLTHFVLLANTSDESSDYDSDEDSETSDSDMSSEDEAGEGGER